MRIVVTGGRGFIGSAVERIGKERGHDVRSYDKADALDVRHMTPGHLEGIDAVIHLAGVLGTSELFDEPDRAIDVNVIGSLRVIEACTEADAHLIQITMPQCWSNVYQATKDCAGQLADAWCDNRDLRVTHVRAYNAYGPGQKVHGVRKIIPTFATAAWRQEPIDVWGDGRQLVDLIHVDDIALMMIEAAEHAPGDGETIDAGTGVGHSVESVARVVADQAGLPPDAVQFHAMRDGESPRRGIQAESMTVARGEGWHIEGITVPKYRPGALAATVEWYRQDRP